MLATESRDKADPQSKLVGKINPVCEIWVWLRDLASRLVEKWTMTPNINPELPDAPEYSLQQKQVCTHMHTTHTCETQQKKRNTWLLGSMD